MDLKFDRWLLMKRKDLGLNQEDIAAALGVSRTTVSNWETGRAAPSLSIEQIKTLCQITQTRIEDIPNPSVKSKPND